jgi:putative hydrolase of the HAD superfamily
MSQEWPGAKAILVDYGGVLTNPLVETVAAYAGLHRIAPALIGQAQRMAGRQLGADPMALLEIGAISEADFLAAVGAALNVVTGRDFPVRSFREQWFRGRTLNAEFLAHVVAVGRQGYRTALVTNNVREWRDHWQRMVPPSLFDVVVDSSVEGVRKPERAFFEIALGRLALPPEECLLIDDNEENCAAARALGFRVIQFLGTAQAIRDIHGELAS